MARDCPDRPRGADWRNGPAPATGGVGGRPAAGRIGAGDVVDQEMEVSFIPNLLKTTKLTTSIVPHERAIWWRSLCSCSSSN